VIGNILISLLILLQSPADEPTALERLTPDFYGAVGKAVELEWQLNADAVDVGKPIRAILRVRGATNPAELIAPKAIFSNANAGFQVIVGPSTVVSAKASTMVEFAYDIVPNRAGKQELPSVKYAYYRPGFPEGRRFAVVYAEAKSFTATSPSTTVPKADAVRVPPELFEPNDGGLPPWATLMVIAALPWWLYAANTIHRRLFPDAAGLAVLHRSRAVGLCWRRLGKCHTATDVRSALLEWLKSRHGLPTATTTSSEISTGRPNAPIWEHEAIKLLADCERSHYAGRSEPTPGSLIERAKALLTAVEGRR